MYKLKRILESVYYDIYENRTETASVFDKSELGKGTGFYVETDKYDKEFKNQKELAAWLKKNKFRHVGVDSM